MRDAHSVLGLSSTATLDEVKAAYRSLVKQHHPDVHPLPSRPQAEAAFKEINDAYARLTSSHGQESGFSSGASSRQPSRHTGSSWTAVRPPAAGKSFHPGIVAMFICLPLAILGVMSSSKYSRAMQESGRVHGILAPPVNPFLADEYKPRQVSIWDRIGTPTSRPASPRPATDTT